MQLRQILAVLQKQNKYGGFVRLYTSGTAPLNPCHALLQTYFSASFVILLLSLQNKVGVK